MSWLYPSFLWALFLLAIPIIIHLFNFRRYKTIEFTNIKFLKQINTETKSGNKLKKYLILASRLLAFSFLVFAFAQPIVLKNKQNNTTNYISIVLDNSFSMNLSGKEGPLLEAAKNRARAIVSRANNADKFQIITTNLDPALFHFFGKEETLENIDKIKPEPEVHPLSVLLETQNRFLSPLNGNKESFVISDFQANVSNLNKRYLDTSIKTSFLKVPASNSNNLSIDSCFLLSPIVQKGQNIQLAVAIKNYSSQAVEDISIEIYVNKKPKGVTLFSVPAFEKKQQIINFSIEEGGNHLCELRLVGDEIPLDDKLFFTLQIANDFNVLNIQNEENKYINTLFSDNKGFSYKVYSKSEINYSVFGQQSLIILNELDNLSSGMVDEVAKYVSNGGNVLVLPNKSLPFGGLQNFAKQFGFQISEKPVETNFRINQIDFEHPVFKNIFEKKNNNVEYPSVIKSFQLQFSKGNSLMKMQNGSPFMQDIEFKNGHIYFCATPLNPEMTNFQNNALFVPVLLKMAMLSKQKTALYQIIGKTETIYTGLKYKSENTLVLKNEETTIVPEVLNINGDLFLGETSELKTPGHYFLKQKNKDSALLSLGFNLNRIESDTRLMTNDELTKMCSPFQINTYFDSSEKFASEYLKLKKGTSYWKWCIIFVLIFLIIEILLIRFYKPNAKLSI